MAESPQERGRFGPGTVQPKFLLLVIPMTRPERHLLGCRHVGHAICKSSKPQSILAQTLQNHAAVAKRQRLIW